jgi:hypothetical protein
VVAAARDAFVEGMQLSSAIAAGVAVGVAVMALVTLRDQPAPSTEAAGDEDLASVSTAGDGRPDAGVGSPTRG